MKNRCWKIGLFYAFWFIPLIMPSQTITTHPSKPRLGQLITFEFTPNPASQNLESLNLILYTHLLNPPDTLAMLDSELHWTASTTIEDTSVSMLFFYLEGFGNGKPFYLNNHGSPYELYLYTMTGAPVKGAYMVQGLARSGYGNILNADPENAIDAIDKELKLYPDNFSARSLKYTLLMQEEGLTNETIFLIREDIKKILRQEKESIEALKFALQAYQMIVDDQEIQRIQEQLIRKDPTGPQAAARQFNEIMSLDNSEEQALALESFIQDYPDSRLTEIALSQLASTVIEMEDSTAMINVGDRLLIQSNTMAGASGLSALAGVLAEKKWQLNHAQKYINRSLEIISTVNPTDHPPEMSDAEWQERIQYTKARYQDIAGWLLYQQNDLQRAVILLEEASQNAMEPGILYHLAETLRALQEEERAIAAYARVIAYGGGLAEMSMERLDAIWQAAGRDTTQLKALLNLEENQVHNEYVNKILQRRQIKKASDFRLKRVSGGQTKLSETLGQKTLLCFWGTWSDASVQIIDLLQDMSYRREDIQILAVAVDRNASDVSRFVRDNRIPFQVLLIDQKVEQDYNLKGVPVLFVVDTTGHIHFQHKGYRPDLIEILNIELDNLE
ncbi:redoxin domain-containing protein [bacterium]